MIQRISHSSLNNATLLLAYRFCFRSMKAAESLAISSASRLQNVKYVNVASAVVFIFDYFQTLGMEVDYIWGSPLHIAEILFYISRYSPFLDLPTAIYYVVGPDISYKMCSHLKSVSSWSTVLGIAVAEAIMLLRTWALWGNSRPLLICLTVPFFSICILCIVFLTLFLRSLQYGPPPLSTVAGCYLVARDPIVFLDYALIIVYETFIISLTLWIGIKEFRQSRSPLVQVLYRDGAFYFIYTFLASAGNVIVLLAGPPEYVDLLNTFQRVMHSVLSTRTVLHVRSTGSRGNRWQTSMAVSNLRFRQESGDSETTAVDDDTLPIDC